jgi:TPR repeat protein
MTEEPQDEAHDERMARLNFFSDAARAGLHSAGADILAQMNENGVREAASCVLAGACQFLAELYEQTAAQLGADKTAMRAHMVESVGMYFDTYAKMSVLEQAGQSPEVQ